MNVTILLSDDVVVYAPKFLRLMAEKVSETPNRTLANYLIWRITMYRVTNLPKSLIDIRRQYRKVGIASICIDIELSMYMFYYIRRSVKGALHGPHKKAEAVKFEQSISGSGGITCEINYFNENN